jgi:potassium inwardly-rectifying channel subfamily J
MRFTVQQPTTLVDTVESSIDGRRRRSSMTTVVPSNVGVHLLAQSAAHRQLQQRRLSAGPTLYTQVENYWKIHEQQPLPAPPFGVSPLQVTVVPETPRARADDVDQCKASFRPTWVLHGSTVQLVGKTDNASDESVTPTPVSAANAVGDDEDKANEKSQLLIAGTLAECGQQFAGRQTRRLVHKDGTCNISRRNVTERKRKYLVDIFTTLVDMRWRYNVLLFTAAFVVSWLAFSVVWYVIARVHSDTEHRDDEDWEPCVSNVYDFPSALLFSIETQSTIGYGYRVITPFCVVPFFVLVIQTCFGVFMQSLLAGLVFAKMSRPKQRAHTIMFSNKAVIVKRDYEYCLLFRVGDMRKSHFIGTSIRAMLIQDRLTKEGEVIPLCQNPLDLETETCNSDNFVFLVWPVTVVHKINSSSPLWDISAEQMLSRHFEIVVILEGVVESTGGTTQLRTSYLPSEILWGHRLSPLLTYQKENGQYKIDYTQFHAVEPIQMPDCSAKTLAERRRRAPDDENVGEDADYLPVYFTISNPTSKSLTVGSRGGSIVKRMRNSVTNRRRSTKTQRQTADADAPDEADGDIV